MRATEKFSRGRAEYPFALGCALFTAYAVLLGSAGAQESESQKAFQANSAALDYFDVPAAGKRIEEAVALAKRKFTIDTNRVLLAGFSQGGGVALRMVGDHPERYCGAVAVCSLCQSPGTAYWEAVARKRPVRVVVMAGKLDRLLPRSRQAIEELRAAHVTSQYDEIERVGHEYPSDYPEKLHRAMEFVLEAEPAQKPG